MDAIFLSRMIKDLMLDNDTLGLPGLGTFVAEEMPASFSDKGYTINPPYRRLGFVERETPDGLLAALYAEANQLALDESEAILGSYLEGIAAELREHRTVDLPGLGRLRATRGDHFFFVPDEALDISPEACGLVSVSLKTHSAVSLPDIPVPVQAPAELEPEPVPEPAPVPEAVPEPEAVPAAPAKPRRRLHPALRWSFATVAAVAVLLAGFVALSRIAPDFTDKLLYTEEELSIINYPEDGLGLPG